MAKATIATYMSKSSEENQNSRSEPKHFL